jgi:hypothetical protein
MKRALVLVILIVITAEIGNAAEYVIMGAGIRTCGTWTAARRERRPMEYEAWILGYLSGIGSTHNLTGVNPLQGVDAEGVWAWIDNYCSAHPLAPINQAAITFANTHRE